MDKFHQDIRDSIRQDFINGKFTPIGFRLLCPEGHDDTAYEDGATWFCAKCRKEFLREDSLLWKKKIEATNLKNFVTDMVVEGFPDVKVVLQFIMLVNDAIEIRKVVNVKIVNGVNYGFNESAQLAQKALENINVKPEFEDGYNRGLDIIMVVKR